MYKLETKIALQEVLYTSICKHFLLSFLINKKCPELKGQMSKRKDL